MRMTKRRPNIVDIAILLVVAAVIILGVYKFGVVNKQEFGGIDEATAKTTYTALIDEVRMATVNALHVGDKIFDEKTGVCIGEIKEVTHTPFTRNVLDSADQTKTVEFPDRYSVRLTIEGAVIEKPEGYFVDGVAELKVNSEMNVITKYAKPVMKVTDIEM